MRKARVTARKVWPPTMMANTSLEEPTCKDRMNGPSSGSWLLGGEERRSGENQNPKMITMEEVCLFWILINQIKSHCFKHMLLLYSLLAFYYPLYDSGAHGGENNQKSRHQNIKFGFVYIDHCSRCRQHALRRGALRVRCGQQKGHARTALLFDNSQKKSILDHFPVEFWPGTFTILCRNYSSIL